MGARRFLAAVALSAGTLLLTACASRAPVADGPAAPGGTWTELPSAPLSPRLGAVTGWTGSEALFLGGDVADLCPPDAGCARSPESATDGAAFDPATQTWRTLADAPHPVAAGTPSTVDGDTVHLVQDDRLVSYDASEDAWSVSPPAPIGAVSGDPAALDDGTVVVVDSEREAAEPAGQVYDLATRIWTELPDDPLGPGFDRRGTAVPGGLVLTGVPEPDVDTAEPPPAAAAVLDVASGTWTPLGQADRAGGWNWSWTGERMVDVAPDALDGTDRRFAQGGALDPRTGDWSALPDAPLRNTGGWPATAVGGALAAVDGWVYDDRDRTWTLLDRPDGAPAEPGSAVWAGDALIVLGGLDTEQGWGGQHLTDRVWVWRPAAAAPTASPPP